MAHPYALTVLCISTLGLACSTVEPGATASLSGSESESATFTGDDGDDDSNQPTGSASNGDTLTGGMTSNVSSGSTTGDPSSPSSPSEATDGVTSEPDFTSSTGGPDDDTTTSEPGDDTSTTADDTTTDTGDDTTSDTGDDTTTGGVDPACQAPATQPPCDADTTDIFKAIGLNCSDDKSMAIPIANPVIMAPDAASYRVTSHFGSAKDPMDPNLFAWGPREGSRLLAIGTGRFPALQNDGGLIEPNGSDSEANNNPDGLQNLPGVMKYAKGSNNGAGGTPFMNCDGVNDCSDTLDPQWNLFPGNVANDVFYMSFDLQVPLGTYGYLFDFAYFSEEWPNYVDDIFNDMFVVWSTSESFTGNVTFINDQPLTVTALDPFMTIQPGNPLLAGTGFPGDNEGASTGWFSAKGSAVPGETFTVAVSIFDMGDTVWDTVGLIDKFRWDCEGCIPSEIDSCGIMPQ